MQGAEQFQVAQIKTSVIRVNQALIYVDEDEKISKETVSIVTNSLIGHADRTPGVGIGAAEFVSLPL